MNYNLSIPVKCLGCLFCALCSGTLLYAQSSETDSLQAVQDKRIVDHYSFTDNAATIGNDYLPRFGYAKAQAGFLSGDFRRPMQPSHSSVFSLSTGGSRKTGRWNLLADFQYRKIYDDGVAWAAVNDPYAGNPFIWADSSSGRWDRDHIGATIGAATELSQRLKAGLVIDYAIGTGARTSEPKPFYRMRNISLQPGITWKLSKTDEIGISGAIGFLQEENEIGYYSNSNVLLYRLRGYGTFSKSPFVSGERKRKGTAFTGSWQYRKQWKKYNLSVSGSAAQTEEEVFEGVASTQTTGYFTGINFAGKLRLHTGTAMKGKALEFVYENKNGYADDMIFRTESASYLHRSLQAVFSCWKQRTGGRALIQCNLVPSLTYIDYTDQSTYLQFTATTLGSMIELNYRKKIGRKIKLQVQPAAGYYHIIDHYFTARANQVVIRELILPDYHYFSTNYWKAACRLELELGSNKMDQSHLIAMLADSRWPGNNDRSHRTLFQLQYSILF